MTRWKLLAGLLGLSMGGVAAIADPPSRVQTAGAPAVLPCPAPVVSVPAAPAAAAVEVIQVGVQLPLPIAEPSKATEPMKLDLLPQPVVAVTAEAPPAATLPVPVAVVPAAQAPELPPPTAAPTVTGPATTPPPLPAVEPEPRTPRLDSPSVPVKPAEPAAAQTTNIRVIIQLGVGQPRFEVLSGDDTVLKVVSERVDVRSPSEKGEVMSALKADGTVRFTAPGCEGVCNELTVRPGSGDVELSGDVRVKCKQGKGSTEIVAAKMTFKLGAAPAYAVSEPDTGAVTASFNTPIKR